MSLQHQRLVLGMQRNSAKSAMWSEDHSGDGRAVSFLKLSSSSSSNNDSTVNVSAETIKTQNVYWMKRKTELQIGRHWWGTCVKYVIKCAYEIPGTVGKQGFIWRRIHSSPLLLSSKAASHSCKGRVSTNLHGSQGEMIIHTLQFLRL